MHKNKSGNLYVVAAPSGTGKTTLVKALVDSQDNITVSISHTTRKQRSSEIHGINYYFISESQFITMIENNEFLEHALVFGNLYGTSRQWVESTLNQGIDVILEIDWQGCQQIQKIFPECISIFILPPTFESLKQRLYGRNQDTSLIIEERMANVREAILHIHEYNYVIVNDHFETALNDLKTIINAGKLLQKKQVVKYANIIQELANAAVIKKL